MRISEEALNKILEKGYAKINRGTTVPVTNTQLPVWSEPLEEKKSPRFNSPVDVTVRSFRRRLTDIDGASVKAALDGIVKAGVLVDDGPKYIKKITFVQFKILKGEEEKTEIVLEVTNN